MKCRAATFGLTGRACCASDLRVGDGADRSAEDGSGRCNLALDAFARSPDAAVVLGDFFIDKAAPVGGGGDAFVDWTTCFDGTLAARRPGVEFRAVAALVFFNAAFPGFAALAVFLLDAFAGEVFAAGAFF